MADDGNLAAGPSAGGGNKIVVIVSIVNLVATVAIIGLLFVSFNKEKSKETVADIVKGSEASGEAGGEHGESAKAEEHGGGGGEHGGGHGGGAAHADANSLKVIHLDPFTVNLTTGIGASPRYVRMNVSVELEKNGDVKEFEANTPRVRDTIINLLNAKKASDLSVVEGREQLKEDIKSSTNAFLQKSKVKGVYFTNFAITQ